MIRNVEITGIHMQVGDDLHKYVTKKIGGLEKFVPRTARESIHAQVLLKEEKKKGAKLCICEITVHLPHETINISEGTVNIFAAVDIVEEKLKIALKKYKDLHANPKLHQRALTYFKRRPVPEV
jgi:ribosomal subunit interface protein